MTPDLPELFGFQDFQFQRLGFVTSFKATVWTDMVDGGWDRGKKGKDEQQRRKGADLKRERKLESAREKRNFGFKPG